MRDIAARNAREPSRHPSWLLSLGILSALFALTTATTACEYESQVKAADGYSVELVASGLIRVDGIARDLQGALIVSQEYRGGSLLRVDPRSGTYTYIARDLASPDNVVVRPDGEILVTEEFAEGRIISISPVGEQTVFASDLQKPEGLDVDKDGYVYVVEHWIPGRLFRFAPDGTRELISDQIVDGEGLRVIDDGSIIVAETSANRLARVYPDGSIEYLAEGGIEAPDGVVYDFDREVLYVTEDLGPGRLVEVDLETGAVTTLAYDMSAPQTMLIEDDGSILVAEQGEDRVLRIRRNP